MPIESQRKHQVQPAGKRRSSPAKQQRGGPHPPQAVAPVGKTLTANRVLAVKVEIDWKSDESKTLYRRLRDLSWQAAHYRNTFIRARWAEARGYTVPDPKKDSPTKEIRGSEKAELSGAAYSAAEREVSAAWQRDGKKMLAGQPLAEWKPSAALSIRGHKVRKDSGVRIEVEDDQYICYLSAQSKDSSGGCWLRVPVAKNTRRDEYQRDVLDAMVAWDIPIAKASVKILERGIILRLTYARTLPLPAMGERVATLGPVTKEGRLLLRTELETKDYTAKLARFLQLTHDWELIRRRVMAQIGRKKGHARAKRHKLAQMPWRDRMQSYLHEWSREIVKWCDSQGVGTINVLAINSGDWPAYQFTQLVRYKAEECGIQVNAETMQLSASTDRAAKAVIGKERQRASRRRKAVRELEHQLKETQ